MNMFFKRSTVGVLMMMLGAFVVTPTKVAAVTVVSNTVVTTQTNTPWVTIRPDPGEGIWHVCAAALWPDPIARLIESRWTDCYNTFVAENLKAGNRMYQVAGQWRLYRTQAYTGPRPATINTAADTAAVMRLGDLLERINGNTEKLAQLELAIGATTSDITLLTSRLDAFELRLDAVEEVNDEQTERLDDIDRTLTELVDGQTNAGLPWWTWLPALILFLLLFLLLILAIYSLFKLVMWVIDRLEPKQPDPERFATKAALESLEGKVDNEAAKLMGLDKQVADLGEQLSDNEVVADAALTLASPLKITETTDLSSLNIGATSTWTATDTKTGKEYVIPFTKNEDGMIEAPILRRAGHPHFIQPFRFRSKEGTVKMLRLAHADWRLEECLKHTPKA